MRVRAWDYLPGQWGRAARAMEKSLCEIRLRRGGPVALREIAGGETLLPPMEDEGFSEMISAMLDHSLYARESELDKGYFTLPDGSRAGVCGDFSRGIRAPEDVLSLCIRIARAVPGCAAALIPALMETSGALIVSPPGLGKTTLLRDAARLLSRAGQNVCLVDERGELAAMKFQPTRPPRDATRVSLWGSRMRWNFNPRAPRGARRAVHAIAGHAVKILTHAPLAGRDIDSLHPDKFVDLFQPTRPSRGATCFLSRCPPLW